MAPMVCESPSWGITTNFRRDTGICISCLSKIRIRSALVSSALAWREFLWLSYKNPGNRGVYDRTTDRPLTMAVFMVTTTRQALCWRAVKLNLPIGHSQMLTAGAYSKILAQVHSSNKLDLQKPPGKKIEEIERFSSLPLETFL